MVNHLKLHNSSPKLRLASSSSFEAQIRTMESRLNKILQVLKEPESLIVIIGIIVAAVLAYSGIRNNDIQQALAAILSILNCSQGGNV
ncbi:MAG: hypothetical protein FJ011_25555 [Chloroflexi bacterium]|nr:hypothetical protein [Chloroflexota bacterium]